MQAESIMPHGWGKAHEDLWVDFQQKVIYALAPTLKSLIGDKPAMVTESIEIQMLHEGEDVANATMEIDDAISVLQGFAGAYVRIANTENPDVDHRITLTGIKEGSIVFLLEVIAENPEIVAAGLEVVANPIAARTLEILFEVIATKLHVAGRKAIVNVEGNQIGLTNSSNVTKYVSQQVYNFYGDKAVNRNLDTLTKPLAKEGIDAAEYKALPGNDKVLSQRVESEDRPLFEAKDGAEIEVVQQELVVTLATLTKKSNKGWLYTHDNDRVPFNYVGDHPERLHTVFGTYYGKIKAQCEVMIRDGSDVTYVTIHDFQTMQNDMFNTDANS